MDRSGRLFPSDVGNGRDSEEAICMTRILLTGAGFSRNWGGWLANEAFEYLLGCDGIHPRARQYLWNHKERGTGFEGVYQALKDEATNLADTEVFKQFHDMVSGMFHVM